MAPPDSPDELAADPAGELQEILRTLVRLACFALLAGAALAILACVVLLPAHTSLLQARYERDLLIARNSEDDALIQANHRLIEAIPNDSVLAKRLVMQDFGLQPRTEWVIPNPASQEAGGSQWMFVNPEQHPPPQKPDEWIVQTAAKLQAPGKRTLLLLVAVAAFVGSMVVSGSGRKRQARTDA